MMWKSENGYELLVQIGFSKCLCDAYSYIFMYISAHYRNSTNLVHYDQTLTDARIYLPYGQPSEQYLIDLHVKIIDEDKAFSLYDMGYVRVSVTVNPAS